MIPGRCFSAGGRSRGRFGLRQAVLLLQIALSLSLLPPLFTLRLTRGRICCSLFSRVDCAVEPLARADSLLPSVLDPKRPDRHSLLYQPSLSATSSRGTPHCRDAEHYVPLSTNLTPKTDLCCRVSAIDSYSHAALITQLSSDVHQRDELQDQRVISRTCETPEAIVSFTHSTVGWPDGTKA